jgi:hypothetical protein
MHFDMTEKMKLDWDAGLAVRIIHGVRRRGRAALCRRPI